MQKELFSEEEQEALLKNENVLKVSPKSITYHPKFKIHAVKAFIYEHVTPTEIFINAGLSPEIIGQETPRHCLYRWCKIYNKKGEQGLILDQRGKKAIGRPLERELTTEEKLRRAEAKIEYLERENELLKKLEELEKGAISRSSTRYELIHSVLNSYKNNDKNFTRNLFSISYLCEIAGVSRSGYYRWLANTAQREKRDQVDYTDYLIINEIFTKKNCKAGWRVIRMNLERKGIIMNHKKIRRLMKKYKLIAQLRKRNPYKQIAKATMEHSTHPNTLARQFKQNVSFTSLGTDITYLYYGNGQKAYLSVILDYSTGEILTHYLSASLGMKLSLEPIRALTKKLPNMNFKNCLIHSDQGFHYTSPFYRHLLKANNITQSMSRKGNCLDNAPVESFFGHMKDEIEIINCKSFNEVKLIINKYIFYYNNFRYQWVRKKMAPVEYRNHLLTA